MISFACRAVVAAAVLALAVAGCGGTSSPSVAADQGSNAPSPAGSLPGCTIYAQQHDAQIDVNPDNGECDQLIKDLSAGGDAFWSYQPSGPALDSLAQACDVTSSDGTYEAVVLDDPGGYIGQDVCSGFVGAGWTVNKQPGQLAQQVAQEQGQAQAAQASASAAQASASASASQEASAQNDVSTLQQDTNFTPDVNVVSGDVKTTDGDVATTRSDAASGNGDQCINASTTVYNDAATTVYNDVLTTVYNDAASVGRDISTLRSDISTVQNDQQGLSSAGLPGTPGAGAAIAAAQSAISSAIATVNVDIDHANGDLATAYQIADSVGTGPCAGDGPGKLPSGVSHLT
jgi:hypothetical protein